MSEVCVVFPHQLYRDHPCLVRGRVVILVEEVLFFRQYAFHAAKLVLHRASMRAYEDWLKGRGHAVRYIEAFDDGSDCRILVERLAGEGVDHVYVAEPGDDWLRRRLTGACRRFDVVCSIGSNSAFLNTVEEGRAFFEGKSRYFQHDFYIWQRSSRGLLMDQGQQPVGGQWSFDPANRKRFPRGAVAPAVECPSDNAYIAEARGYVAQHFPGAYGDPLGRCMFAVTFDDADLWLRRFVSERLDGFGPFEDAISQRYPFLFHSVLTPMLNIGLLTPDQVIGEAIAAGRRRSLPIASLEGFVRQVAGWREYIRIVYELEGRRQRTSNFWGFTRRIPRSFWTGTTGVGPVDLTIRKVLEYGYCHHIERLMVLGNFMLLCEFDPNDVYRWFMEMFIDAYDWVMVPNVYGMSQFADGGLTTTKPYLSGSNYLLKMGDFGVGEWTAVWDGLFWRFMAVHRDYFSGNARLRMLLGTLDRMSAETRAAHFTAAEQFLASLDADEDRGEKG